MKNKDIKELSVDMNNINSKKSKFKIKFLTKILDRIKNNIMYKRFCRCIENIYYDTKWFIKNLKYIKIFTRFRPWDYSYILEIQKELLIDLYKNYKKYSIEVEKDKNKSLKDIKRTIELIQRKLDDDYLERCGYKYDERSLDEILIKIPGKTSYTIADNPNHTDEEKEEIFKNAYKLEERENKELAKLLTKANEWWY